MLLTKLLARNALARTPTHPNGRLPTLLACLLAALGFALAGDADGQNGASDPTPIEFEGSESESTSGDSLEESRATQSIRRLRPRDFERATRVVDRPVELAALDAPRSCAAARPAMLPGAGRDLLIRQQRFLI